MTVLRGIPWSVFRERAGLLVALVIVAVAASSGLGVPTAAFQGHQVYVANGASTSSAFFRPRRWVLAGDGSYYLSNIRWSSYNGPVARARAIAHVENYSTHRFYSPYRVSLRLWNPGRRCGRYFYTKIHQRYPANLAPPRRPHFASGDLGFFPCGVAVDKRSHVLASAVAPAAHAGVMVSLGDSYSSGEGAPPIGGYDRGTDVKGSQHKCHRSAWAWPRLIGVTSDHHLACSGAVINNIPEYGENGAAQNNTAPDDVVQITRLKRISASQAISRVLLTLGGNDKPVNFASRLGTCWAIGPVGCVRDIDKIVSDMGGLRTRLANTYRNIQRASGGAPLLVVGYPDLFPDPSATRTSVHCPWINRAALRRLDRLEASLDSTLSHAARDAGVDYLSMRDVLKGHELCTGKSWLRAIVGKPGDVSGDQQQGHPLKEGQAAIAKRVREWLTEHAHGGGAKPCTTRQLAISLGGFVVGLGHIGAPIRFVDMGGPCSLRGYPTVLAVTLHGHVVARAGHTPKGYLTRDLRVRTVALHHGETASAFVEGLNVAFSCSSYRFLRITPPAASASVQRHPRYRICFPSVHPVVAGRYGDGFSHP